MKHKRMAILFVVVTLAGSPPVWQKLSNFVSAIQHRAQIKFLSMVLQPGPDDSQVRDIPVIEDQYVASRSEVGSQVASDCPAAKTPSKPSKLVANRSNALKTIEQNARAIERTVKEARFEALSHMTELLPEPPKASTVPAVASIPRTLTFNESDVRDLVKLSQRDFSASGFVDGTNPNIHLKLKKILDDRKATRQRTRFIIGTPVVAPPATGSEMPGDDRSG
ncbi:MAG: hypothetical protein QOJ64_1717 [Acidobacteriota bacterium]|jgi:hypothetical protein|nr:hypothetical protein [Acidobacteriota bacterium]